METRIRNTRLFACFVLLLTTPLMVAFAEDTLANFKVTYASYNECLAGNDSSCTIATSKATYDSAKKAFKPGSKNLALTAYNYGAALLVSENRTEFALASEVLLETLSLTKLAFGAESLEVLNVSIDLCSSLIRSDLSGKKIKKVFNSTIALSNTLNENNAISHAQVLQKVGIAQINTSGFFVKSGLGNLTASYDTFLAELGEDNPHTALSAFHIGKVHLAKSKNNKAANYFNSALKGFEAMNRPRSPYAMSTHAFLIEAYEKQGLSDEATKHCYAIGSSTPVKDVENYFPVYKTPPKYPKQAARRKKEATVTVEYTVDNMGFVKNPKVLDATGDSDYFVENAIEAVLAFRYAPRFENGNAVATEGVRNRFTYEIAKK